MTRPLHDAFERYWQKKPLSERFFARINKLDCELAYMQGRLDQANEEFKRLKEEQKEAPR